MSEEGVPEREVVEPVGEERGPAKGAPANRFPPGTNTLRPVTMPPRKPPPPNAATEMHSTAAEPTVETAAAESTAVAERHGWRRHDDRRRHRGRGKATGQFGLHDSDPPRDSRIFFGSGDRQTCSPRRGSARGG